MKKLLPNEILEKFCVEGNQTEFLPLADLIGETYNNLANPQSSIKIDDLKFFSETTKGFRSNEFSILCGATGVGKTTFIANISASLIKQSIPHYVASVETGSLDYVRRVISVFADKDINDGEAVDKKLLYSIHNRFKAELTSKSLHLALYENRTTVEKLMADMAEAHVKHGCKIAIIDNLNFFMEVTSAQNTIIEMDRVVHELIIFCKQVDMHVIMIMHPKKTESLRVESEFDIKGSSLAVQEAHNVFLLNRPSEDDIKNNICTKYDRELKIAKMRRNGRAVGRRIYFKTDNGVTYKEKGYAE